jgi:LPPG:FO 2-phospho-L-lactate transferase
VSAIAESQMVVIGPSNPIVSVGPILAVGGLHTAVEAATGVRVAVSPIIAGRALKGPADRMLASLGHEVSAVGVARLYTGLVDRFVIDEADAALAPEIAALGIEPVVLPTVMRDDGDRAGLAAALLAGVA